MRQTMKQGMGRLRECTRQASHQSPLSRCYVNKTYRFYTGPTGKVWAEIRSERNPEQDAYHQLSLPTYNRFIRAFNAVKSKGVIEIVAVPSNDYERVNWAIGWQATVPDSRERRGFWRIEITRVKNGGEVFPHRSIVGLTEKEAKQHATALEEEYVKRGFQSGGGVALLRGEGKEEEAVYIFVERGERKLWQHATRPRYASSKAPGS